MANRALFTADEIAGLMAFDRRGGDIAAWAKARGLKPGSVAQVVLRERCRPLTYDELKKRRNARRAG